MTKQADKFVECYVIPSTPMPMLVPLECVAEIVAKPEITALKESPANWMRGHVVWQNQRLSAISFASLVKNDVDESKKRNPHMVVLNPIPNAARMSYAGLICYGKIQQIKVDEKASFGEVSDDMDRRYVEKVVKIKKKNYVIPKLSALAVAFTYM